MRSLLTSFHFLEIKFKKIYLSQPKLPLFLEFQKFNNHICKENIAPPTKHKQPATVAAK